MIKFIVSKRIVPAFLAIVATCSFSMVSCFAYGPWDTENSSEGEIPYAPYIAGRDINDDNEDQDFRNEEALPPEGDEQLGFAEEADTISTPAEQY